MNLPMHDCGGSVAMEWSHEDSKKYYYCSKCGAFTFGSKRSMPDGIDPEDNQCAWDEGRLQSPANKIYKENQ